MENYFIDHGCSGFDTYPGLTKGVIIQDNLHPLKKIAFYSFPEEPARADELPYSVAIFRVKRKEVANG